MFRKVTSVSLVLFGLLFFGTAGECLADASAELEQAKLSIISLINEGMYANDDNKYTQAQAQTQKLLADFSPNEAMPAALYEIADKFRWATKNEQVNNLYQQIMQNYPDSPYVSRARLGLARVAILSLIIAQNYDQAKKDFNTLLVDFSGHPDLPETIYWTAERYQWALKYEKAKNLYSQVAQDYPDSPWAGNAKLGAARANVMLHIESQQYDLAKEALDKLVTDFSIHPDLPETLYWVARRYGWLDKYEEEKSVYQQIIKDCPDSSYAVKAEFGVSRAGIMSLIMSQDYDGAEEAFTKLVADFSNRPDLHDAIYWIAEGYERSGKYEKANNLYQQVIQNYPDNLPVVERANFGLSRTNVQSLIMSGQYDSAEESFDKMVNDFPDNPALPDEILYIAGSYYKEALRLEAEGLGDQSKFLFGRALAISEMVKSWSPDYIETPGTLCWIAICYRALGDYGKSTEYCQRIVDDWPDYAYSWQAQFLIGCNYELLKEAGVISEEEGNVKAQAAYEQLLEKYPDCPSAGTARQWLAQSNSIK